MLLRSLALGLALIATALPAQSQEPAKVLKRETLADPGFTEAVETVSPATRYRIRIWAPLTPAEDLDGPVPGVILIDGQADAGLTAAIAREAEARSADYARWVVTVSLDDEPVVQPFKRRAWSAAEEDALAAFVIKTLAPRLKAQHGMGEMRLVGIGRGANVVLRALAVSPAAFASFHAKDHRLTPDQLATLARMVPPPAAAGLRTKLWLSWQLGDSHANPAEMSFLETVKAKGHPFRWAQKETDESFLEASLWNWN